MGTDKRARQKANRQEKLAAERAAAQVEQRKRSYKRIGVIASLAVLAVLAIWFFGRDDDDPDPEEEVATVELEPGGTSEDAVCPADDGSADRVTSFAGAWLNALPQCVDANTAYVANIALSTGGTITVDLESDLAPEAVNAFAILARFGFYDNTPIFASNGKQQFVRAGVPDDDPSGIVAPGFSIAADENADASTDNTLVLTVDDDGVGATIELVGDDGTVDYERNGTVIGTIDSESVPALVALLASHEESTDPVDREQGLGTLTQAVTIVGVTVTEG